MSRANLYFIAVIPHQQLQDKVRKIELDFAQRFNSSRALKVMPHITLKAPFIIPPELHDSLLKWFEDFKPAQRAFTTALNGFGAFTNNLHPVIFIKPVNHTTLILLQHNLIQSFKGFAPFVIQPVDKKFVPHLTVAYRDLTPDHFEKAWDEYKDQAFEDQFEINALHLLQHDGTKWNIIATQTLDA
ncbi:2'-5' RNA ligase family protein [Niabella hibiscisoli]|uniref:2'-5' RNA ligase family protein n=1 Tax=Niabella hibiscisoli TaxID=1825928 RepID=UPI001F112536|nr:2'-5' RNA ligase family protein [Niabella hibiscisoli]MCH5715029.1 2'-5' RNA ligase family protein [Niabella hibiscisoli]